MIRYITKPGKSLLCTVCMSSDSARLFAARYVWFLSDTLIFWQLWTGKLCVHLQDWLDNWRGYEAMLLYIKVNCKLLNIGCIGFLIFPCGCAKCKLLLQWKPALCWCCVGCGGGFVWIQWKSWMGVNQRACQCLRRSLLLWGVQALCFKVC